MRAMHLPVCSSVRWVAYFTVKTARWITLKLHLSYKLKFELNLILLATGQYNLYVKP